MTAGGFEPAGDGKFQVSGDLSFETVPAVWEQSRRLLVAAGDATIDLGGVTRVDSAGLALVLEWVALAESAGRRMRIARVPDKLVALARLSEVDTLLGVAS